MQICGAVATQAFPTLEIYMFMALGITCIVYSDVCLRCRVREMLLFNCWSRIYVSVCQ
jgi:hypothetical protein